MLWWLGRPGRIRKAGGSRWSLAQAWQGFRSLNPDLGFCLEDAAAFQVCRPQPELATPTAAATAQKLPAQPLHLDELHRRQLVAQAHARARAKALPRVGVARLGLCAVLVQPALGLEQEGLGELLGVAVEAVDVQVDVGALEEERRAQGGGVREGGSALGIRGDGSNTLGE
jgi:hypothetical protein